MRKRRFRPKGGISLFRPRAGSLWCLRRVSTLMRVLPRLKALTREKASLAAPEGAERPVSSPDGPVYQHWRRVSPGKAISQGKTVRQGSEVSEAVRQDRGSEGSEEVRQ